MPIEDEFTLDLDRHRRTGLGEAIFCEGKSLAQLDALCGRVVALQQPTLFTRLSADTHASLDAIHPGMLRYEPISRTAMYQAQSLREETLVAIVTGGSSDVPVAREASRTLAFYGHPSHQFDDVGVAGLWRLTDKLAGIRAHKIVICVAGMDAALPTVLGGLIGSVLIAVPTSVGYGMVRGGETALRSMLVSCAPGITVVNIDNGYGAACAALRVLNLLTTSDR